MLDLKSQIHQLIEVSSINEAIVLLKSAAKKLENNEIENHVTLVASQYDTFRKKSLSGELSFETKSNLQASINSRILEIMDYIENSSIYEKTPPTKNAINIRPSSREIESYCRYLFEEINSIDIECQWNPNDFVFLEAKVISENTKGFSSSVVNLTKEVLKNKTSKSFLILGEPGSGKSVAMRKLAKQMIQLVNKSEL